jgi:hypothetical protein
MGSSAWTVRSWLGSVSIVQYLTLHVPGQVISFLIRHVGFLFGLRRPWSGSGCDTGGRSLGSPGQGHSGDLLRDAHGGGCVADRLGRVWFSGRVNAGEVPRTGRHSASGPWLPITVWVRRW